MFADDRGNFFESFNEQKFRNSTGAMLKFVQDNQSYSKAKVLRGLHYQIEQPQGEIGARRVGRGVGCRGGLAALISDVCAVDWR